jgi:hypothetical protein
VTEPETGESSSGPHRRAAQRRHPSKGRRRSPSLPRERRDSCASRSASGESRSPLDGASSTKGVESPVSHPNPPQQRCGPAGFHSSMPRSNPHARERVMDDRKHLDAFASFVPFAGRETSSVSSAGTSRGSALQTPTCAPVTKRCSRLRRVGALLVLRGSSTRGSRPVPTRKAVRKNGGLVTGTARSLALVGVSQGASKNESRSDGNHRRSLGWRKSSGPDGDSSPRVDRAPARPAGAARNRPFEGSCSRSYRSGRSRTNGIVVVDARSTGRPRLRAEAKRSDGATPRGAKDRPSDGRRSGSSVLASIVTGRCGRVVLAARSQTPPLPDGKGGLLRQAKAQGGQAERGDGSVRGWGSVDVAGRNARLEKPKPTSSEARGAS